MTPVESNDFIGDKHKLLAQIDVLNMSALGAYPLLTLVLLDDCQCTAHECGSPVVANGGGSKVRYFVCKFKARVYQVNKLFISTSQAHGPFRSDALINCDKGGHRENGRSMIRHTTTGRALSSEEVFPFKIMIKWDEHGFYVNLNCSSGCGKHKNHAKLNAANIPFSTKLLPKEDNENLVHLAKSCAWSGVGRNYIHSKLGKYVSRAKNAWLQDSNPSKLLEP
eukprot:scaffold11222_cov56-Attheya_sp.AAC.3